MDTPGYVILSSLGAQLRTTQVLAANMANADTPGFQAKRPIFAQYLQPMRPAEGGPRERNMAYAIDRATWRSLELGPISTTNNPLDIALRADGYFAVETQNGERYTRAGRFSISPDGRIVDMSGHAVLDTNGRPIAVGRNDTRLEVQGDGTIRSENGVIARLRVVRFDDPQAMRTEGDRLLAADETPIPVARPQIIQGAIEGANVKPVQEMVRLTEEVRNFENAVSFADRESERLQTAVERILRRRT